MLRNFTLLLVFVFSQLSFSQIEHYQIPEVDEITANVYFDAPTNNSHHQLSASGTVGVSYHMLNVSNYFIVDWYGAKVQYPNGNWSVWQNGQSGGWVFNTPGTYHIQGGVHVRMDISGESNYYMYSNILTFYVDPYIPPPLNATMSGPNTLNSGQSGTWIVTPTGGRSPYTYTWSYYYHCSGEEKPINNGNPNIDDVPCGYWWNSSNTTNTFTKSISVFDMTVKCIVRDAAGATKTVSKYVTCLSSLDKSISNLTSKVRELSLGSYPNPFNPATKLKALIPNNGMVSLKIYDILGREVAILANDIFEAGEYEFDFDANSLPSGVYISSLTANNKTITQKLLLIK